MADGGTMPWDWPAPVGVAELETDDDDFLVVETWPRDVYGPHYHEEFNWLVPMRHGRLVVNAGGEELSADGEHWICVLPRVPHRVIHVSDDAEILSLFLPQKLMHRAFCALEPQPKLRPAFVGSMGTIARGLALQWGRARFQKDLSDPFAEEFALFLAGWIWRGSRGDGVAVSLMLRLRQQAGALGASVAAHIEEHLADAPFSYDALAHKAGVSLRTLQRQLNEAIDLSPTEIVAELRLVRARELLVDPARPLGDVALACGYSSQAHFSTAFKAATGLSPSQWRRSQLEPG